MSSVLRYREYAADCVRQAQAEEAIEDRTILLNVALAWLRLAQQVEVKAEDESLPPVSADAADQDAARQHELML